MKKIVLCGGGTAGHVYPALAVAEKLQSGEQTCQLHFFGGAGIEKEILKNYPQIKFHQIPTVKFVRKLTLKNLLLPFKLQRCVRVAKSELQRLCPDVIFSKGGYVCVPVVLAAKKLHIPIVSHESDLSLGLANKLILKKCNMMCTTFEETASASKKCVHTGQPIREQIFHGKKLNLNFPQNRPTILVLGGSLGAKFLNDAICENLDKILQKFNIIHIFGKKNAKNTKKIGYFPVSYAENIEDFYATADLVISRAGSGVINELLALSKPMLLVPLSKRISRGDQIENAKLFEEKGFCEVLQEEEFSFDKLMQKLEKLQKNASKMKKNMKKAAKINSSTQIAAIIMHFANKNSDKS